MSAVGFSLWVAALAIAIVAVFGTVGSTHDVWVSQSTGECVKVVPEGSCDDLPDRYTVTVVR